MPELMCTTILLSTCLHPAIKVMGGIVSRRDDGGTALTGSWFEQATTLRSAPPTVHDRAVGATGGPTTTARPQPPAADSQFRSLSTDAGGPFHL